MLVAKSNVVTCLFANKIILNVILFIRTVSLPQMFRFVLIVMVFSLLSFSVSTSLCVVVLSYS